jgi:hypothetical protein
MQKHRLKYLLATAAGLALTLTAGCGGLGANNQALTVGTALSGNWAFAPSNSTAATLNLGFTQGAYETVSAVAHLNGVSCVSPATNILLTGSVSGSNQMMLVSSAFGGTTLTLRGQVAENGKGIAGATWNFSGGSCASLGNANVAATEYSEIAGTYTGTFLDASGDQLAVSAFLDQTTLPDQNGQFSLSGTASFPANTCFVQQPTMTQSLVTGSLLSMTYTDPGSGAVLSGGGTFNSSATQLTMTRWSIVGGACDGDSGTGTLSEEQ